MSRSPGSFRRPPLSAARLCALLLAVAPLVAIGAESPPPMNGQETPGEATATNSCKRVHAFVSGRVQGVGFRNFTAVKAKALGLKGWVRNLDDGRVEVVAEGPAAAIEQLMAAVAKGPGGGSARVDKVERKEAACTGEFKSFAVTR